MRIHKVKSRSERFRLALCLTGQSMARWSKEKGFTQQVVHRVASGNTTSKNIARAIDSFSDAVIRKVQLPA